jgi:tetratricopeptide (TPR) repeat protein
VDAPFLTAPAPRRRARWRWAVLAIAVVVVGLLAVAGGAALSTADASKQAAQLSREGRYAEAVALYQEVARRTGPLYLLARGTVNAAPLDEQRTMLGWAAALAAQGRVDAALRLAQNVTEPRLRSEASSARARLLLAAARSSAASGDYATAVVRLQQLAQLVPESPAALQTTALLPQYEVGEAHSLMDSGDGVDAVALLDSVAGQGVAGHAAASQALPGALLAAGTEELHDLSYAEATATLRRLVNSYGATAPARAARSILGSREPVGGTLTERGGAPISGEVRLSSNFQNLGSGYVTSGPFFYSSAASTGDFIVHGVPQGGPYVLEVFHNGDWTTLIDPTTGRPADPVSVDSLAPVDLTFIVLPS